MIARDGAEPLQPILSMYPWTVSAAARESIAWGNQFRSKPVTDRALARIGNVYGNLSDPYLRNHEESGAWRSFFTRTAFEQFPYQHSVYNEIGRVSALLQHDYSKGRYEVLSRDAWEELLGANLPDFLGAAFLLSTSALVNGGTFDPVWLHQPNFREIISVLPSDVIDSVFHNAFVADYDTVRERARASPKQSEDLRRIAANPLRASPYVRMPDGHYLAPQPHFVTQRISLESLYYLAIARWGNKFTRDLGTLVEVYVGEQFDLLDPLITRYGEIEYSSGQLAVDHILLMPDLAVMVEVKSARVAQPGRLDVDGYLADARQDVGKAFRQIERTAELIRAGDSSFAAIPRDIPLRGLIVTAEPHYLLNSALFRNELTDSVMPTTVISLSELEMVIGLALSVDAVSVIRGITDYDPSTGIDVGKRCEHWRQRASGRSCDNPILAAAWESLPWREHADGAAAALEQN